jgi:hypothetical protein
VCVAAVELFHTYCVPKLELTNLRDFGPREVGHLLKLMLQDAIKNKDPDVKKVHRSVIVKLSG